MAKSEEDDSGVKKQRVYTVRLKISVILTFKIYPKILSDISLFSICIYLYLSTHCCATYSLDLEM